MQWRDMRRNYSFTQLNLICNIFRDDITSGDKYTLKGVIRVVFGWSAVPSPSAWQQRRTFEFRGDWICCRAHWLSSRFVYGSFCVCTSAESSAKLIQVILYMFSP
jgi:hypothetical protein